MKEQILELRDGKIFTDGKVYISKKAFGAKFGITERNCNYIKHKGRVNTLDVLGATFFEDSPPTKKRYRNM